MTTHMWALFGREVKRFQKIWLDTVLSPIVSIGLYLGIFGIVAAGRTIGELPYVTFVYAGLLAMLVVNSSFSNPAFALIISKNVGNIIDLQLVPISAWRVGIAYALAAFTRSLVTLVIALVVTVWFIPEFNFNHPFYILITLLITGLEFGMLGVIFGFLAKNFESLTFMTTFVMQPMIFLAGVFYPVATLPAPWPTVSFFNPIFHNVNVLRYGFTGYADANPGNSLLITLLVTLGLFLFMRIIVRKSLRS